MSGTRNTQLIEVSDGVVTSLNYIFTALSMNRYDLGQTGKVNGIKLKLAEATENQLCVRRTEFKAEVVISK